LLIRQGSPADIPTIARVYVESWRETYQGIAPSVFVEGMTEPAAEKIFTESLQPNSFSYFLHVAEVEGRIVGFADGGKERSHPESGEGELYAIYLLKGLQGKGVGRTLFEASRDSLRRAGMDRMIVWVLEQSPARKFYEAMGGRRGAGIKRLTVTDQEMRLVAYEWQGQGQGRG